MSTKEQTLYKIMSEERKLLQLEGRLPQWLTTMGWQLLKNKGYLSGASDLKVVFSRMAKHAATKLKPEHRDYFEGAFYSLMWDGWFAPSTPSYNLGASNKALSVSCSGSLIHDSITGFYTNLTEIAFLTKLQFGTSSYLGDIRPRGASISGGGTAQGILPVFKMHAQAMADVTQGTKRRGSWAGYLPIMHGDFDEVIDYIKSDSNDNNLGVNYYDLDLIALADVEPEQERRFKKHMHLRATHGKGYVYKPDTVARMQPPMYKKHGLKSLASNLCTEISLHQDADHSYTCVLGSMNLKHFDDWSKTNAVFVATIFLDCIVQDLLDSIDAMTPEEQHILRRVYNGTKKSRALGLGVIGFHTYLQQNMVAFESEEAFDINEKIFTHIHDESLRASQWLAKEHGEPEWCEGYGVANTHRTCVAPTLSSSTITESVSQGIEPIYSNVYEQVTAGGLVYRCNPVFKRVLESHGMYSEELVTEIGQQYDGSVQHLDFLTANEKLVLKTAHEIDQYCLIDLAAQRQPKVCQLQSVNLFIHRNMKEDEFADIHLYALFNPNIGSLYYVRGQAASKGSDGKSEATIPQAAECESCQA